MRLSNLAPTCEEVGARSVEFGVDLHNGMHDRCHLVVGIFGGVGANGSIVYCLPLNAVVVHEVVSIEEVYLGLLFAVGTYGRENTWNV